MVQQEIEAVIMEEDIEEEEGVVLQEEGCPAVIVEEVPSAQVEECYSAQVLVYDDGTYLMQDVAEEQEVVTEVAETGEAQFFECKIQFWIVVVIWISLGDWSRNQPNIYTRFQQCKGC